MYFSQLLNFLHTNFIKVSRCVQIIVYPILNKFISLTDNFIKKKTNTQFLWLPTTKGSKMFGVKIVMLGKNDISHEKLY
jgi:hypothetical protein